MKDSAIQRRLEAEGFGTLPNFKVEPKNPKAEMVVFISGCSMMEFKEGKNHLTKTKYIYPYSDKKYIVNSSAAAAICLLERGIRVVIHSKESDVDLMKLLLGKHPKSDRAHVISGNLGSTQFIKNFYEEMSLISNRTPISKVFLLPYNSFSSAVRDPFMPFGSDDVSLISQVMEARTRLFYFMNLVAYDLLLNKGQEEMRIVALTALNAKRASAHLLTDTLHKAISNVFLETAAYEIPHYTGKKVYVVEIAPGIVDTGIYDEQRTREYVLKESELDGFPFGKKVNANDINTLPMMSALDVAEIAVRYLMVDEDSDINDGLDARLKRYLSAGRSQNELKELIMKSIYQSESSIRLDKLLPSYVYTPNSEYGRLPWLKTGYIPVMLCPEGQFF